MKQGAHWLERAATGGHPLAQEMLAALYDSTFEYFPTNTQKAFQLYLAAAKQGIASSQLTVGIMLCAGNGVSKNVAEGRKWVALSQKQQRNPFSFADAGC